MLAFGSTQARGFENLDVNLLVGVSAFAMIAFAVTIVSVRFIAARN